jgi:hypothetical protein
MTHRDHIFDHSRAVHPFDTDLVDARCALCGVPAAHRVTEQASLPFPSLTNYLCCEHFSFVMGDCSMYPYRLPAQRRSMNP